MAHLADREATVLNAIVSEYVSTGDPVGSRTIAKKTGIGLSAASIRNIMSDLTEMGYIIQPHVSAGRVPTDHGYRFFVDNFLMTQDLLKKEDRKAIRSLLNEAGVDLRDVLRRSSSVLAGLSRQAGVVTATSPSDQTFKTIEFIKVSEDRILVVLVSTSGFVQSKVIFDEDGVDQETLERYSRMLNDMLKDLDLGQARQRIEDEFLSEKALLDEILAKVLRLSHVVLSQEETREVFIEGQANILHEPEFSNVELLRALLLTFEEKSKLLKILDKTLDADSIQIFIGAEHGLGEIESCSIIAYPIRTEESGCATIAVIGPKRMNYGHVIPLVMATGRTLTGMVEKITDHSA
jgi:heat-inducible transcriptional repressor